MPELNIRPRSLMGGLISSDAQTQHVDNIKMIPLDALDHFEGHPFRLYSEGALNDLAESIKEVGIIHPITVRPHGSGRYEILSGHNRSDAAKLAGLDAVPAKVVNIDDDQAMILLVDANLKQRESLTHSEKALAIKKKYEALMHQGKAEAFVPNGHTGEGGKEITSGQAIAGIVTGINENKRNVYRYLQLNNLMPELMEMLDDGQFSFRAAVEISYLSDDEQIFLYEVLSQLEGKSVSIENAEKLRAHTGHLSQSNIRSILAGRFDNDTSDQTSPIKVKAPDQYKQVSSSLTKFLKAKTKQGSEIDFSEIERVVMAAIKAYLGEEEG